MSAPAAPAKDAVLEEVVRELMPDLLAYFIRRTSSRDDAADCLSETLLVLWRRHGALPPDADHLRAWAFGAARRVLSHYRRAGARRAALTERLRLELSAPTTPTTEPDPELTSALKTLKDKDRDLLMLVIWDGFGVAEAGALLGLRPEAARARYSRARRALREVLA